MKMKNILGILLLIGLLSSCQNKNKELRYLPSDANFVMTLTPSVLQQKSGINNIGDTKEYMSIIDNLDSNDRLVFDQFDYIFKNSNESGIDMTKPVFVFSSSNHKGYNRTIGTNFSIKDENKFAQLIDKIISNADDSLGIEKIENDGLHFMISTKASSKNVLAWNNTTAIAFVKAKGYSNRASLIKKAHKLFEQSLSNSLAANNDFNDFFNAHKDISMWVNSKFYMQELPAEYQTMARMQMPISLDNVYFHYYVQFEKGQMALKFELVLPDDLKDFLKEYKIVKPQIDKKMMSFIPKNSIMNISFAINPPELLRMIRDLYSERQIDTKGMEQLFEMATNIKVEKLFKSISGDCIINIHGVKIIRDSLVGQKVQWQFSSIVKIDDKDIYQWFVNQADKNMEHEKDGYIIINKGASELYISMRDSYVMLTNDKVLISNFSKDIPLENSLSDSDIANKLNKYAVYAQLNLDYSAYPQDVQNYFNTKYDDKGQVPFKRKLSQIRYEPIDSYSSELIIDFKKKDINSLRQLMNN